MQELTVEEREKVPPSIGFSFLKQAGHAPLRCEVSDNHVPYSAPYIFSLPTCTPLSSANTFLPYFPVISAFLFLNHFPVLLKDIKIAVINILPIFTNLDCQSVLLLLLFYNQLKTVCKIQCRIHICLFLPVQIVFCDLAIRLLHYQCSI